MATLNRSFSESLRETDLPPLEQGDHLDQPTFHARYEAMPEDVKAELIGGVVYMPSPLKVPHGRHHALLMGWLNNYWVQTQGTDLLDGATVILGEDSEPQPDAVLRILGGQTHDSDEEYMVGPPELVAEVASASESYDLHSKRRDYERLGVQEYLVVVIRQQRVVWLAREGEEFVERQPGDDGILRSRVLPGLWLDPQALLRQDGRRLQEVLQEGLKSAEYAEFARQLQEHRG